MKGRYVVQRGKTAQVRRQYGKCTRKRWNEYVEEEDLDIAAGAGQKKEFAGKICAWGLAFASFPLFLPLISVTSCQYEKVRKVK